VSLNVHGKFNVLNILIMKNLKNLGTVLSMAEQKLVSGGKPKKCNVDSDCGPQDCLNGSRPICADNRCGLLLTC